MKVKEPLMHSTSAAVLNLLTREAVDEEKKMLEEEVVRWKKVADDHKKTIDEHKARIRDLQQIGQCFHLSACTVAHRLRLSQKKILSYN